LPSQDPQHAPEGEKTGKAAILKGKPDPQQPKPRFFRFSVSGLACYTGAMNEPTIRQDPKAWRDGYAAGLAGQTGEAPRGVDGLAWQSGLIEGRADRAKPPADRKPHRRPVHSVPR